MKYLRLNNVLKFLGGILLLQAIMIAQLLIAVEADRREAWVMLGLFSLATALLGALWFAGISSKACKDELARAKEGFLREREKIRVRSEREKTKVVRQSQNQIARERARVQASSNFKIGASVATMVGLGAVMVFTQFVTLGLLTLATAGGAVAGYLIRGRRERRIEGPKAEQGALDRVNRILFLRDNESRSTTGA